jgi:Protein of unknown function (DUF3137)
MVDVPNVETLMAGPLGGWLDRQKALREETSRKSQQKIYWGFGAAGVVLVLVILLGWDFRVAMWGGGALIAGGFGWARLIAAPVENAIKEEMNQTIAQAVGFTYARQGVQGAEFETACAFEVLPSHDEMTVEDFWSGNIDGMPLRLYEVHLQEWRGSGKSRRLETVFRGPLMEVKFARDFLGVTLVERDGSRFKMFFSESITLNGIKLERAKMVDPRFENIFDVWSNDQTEARYLVHPAYCERLVALETQFQGEKLRALFQQGQLIIAVETSTLFESGSLDAHKDHELMAATIRQFSELTQLARQLNERPRA